MMDSQQVSVADRCYWTADGQVIFIDLTSRDTQYTVRVFGPSIAYIDRYRDDGAVRAVVHFIGLRAPLYVMEHYDDLCAALRRW